MLLALPVASLVIYVKSPSRYKLMLGTREHYSLHSRAMEIRKSVVKVKNNSMPILSISNSLLPPVFPELWASSWGEDYIGLWMILTIKNVEQLFRWVNSGEFQMGSPETEKERGSDEAQHRVELTQGFWFADTACTQALWTAVMGKNPARFSDDENNPVESVSWDDIKGFTDVINYDIAGFTFSLPTEAQWEYACRSGTTTSFNLGENITSRQVNYDGDFPYADGNKGEGRMKTVPVKSMGEANAWGLHEMHGNIYEWCQDRYWEYPSDDVIDPVGASDGSERVLRGGGWFYHGKSVRSASRKADRPSFRYDLFGFRLSGQSM